MIWRFSWPFQLSQLPANMLCFHQLLGFRSRFHHLDLRSAFRFSKLATRRSSSYLRKSPCGCHFRLKQMGNSRQTGPDHRHLLGGGFRTCSRRTSDLSTISQKGRADQVGGGRQSPRSGTRDAIGYYGLESLRRQAENRPTE
jgi:hypothetical protein